MNILEIGENLDEKGLTKREAYPLWIWWVIRKSFISRILRIIALGNCRFEDYSEISFTTRVDFCLGAVIYADDSRA